MTQEELDRVAENNVGDTVEDLAAHTGRKLTTVIQAATDISARRTPISKVRDRDSVLAVLVPKMLGILAVRGQKLHWLGGRSVQLYDKTELSVSFIDADRMMLSAYHLINSQTVKVFSAHVTDFPSLGDPTFYRYQQGRIAVMSWRRGGWEDAVTAEPIAPLSIPAAFISGLLGVPREP